MCETLGSLPVKQRSFDIHMSILSLLLNDSSRENKGKSIASTFGFENLEICFTLITSFNCMVIFDDDKLAFLGQHLITGISYSNR